MSKPASGNMHTVCADRFVFALIWVKICTYQTADFGMLWYELADS